MGGGLHRANGRWEEVSTGQMGGGEVSTGLIGGGEVSTEQMGGGGRSPQG